MRRTAFSFLSFFLILASLAFAGTVDPIPLFRSSQSPSGQSALNDHHTLFLCPQTKNFGNSHEKVAVETLILEAVGEGFDGMVAVAEVIRNRTKLFGKTASEVCLMPKQFSCWNDLDRAREFLKEHQELYYVAWMAWLESEKSSLTGGATDYHADYVRPYWADAYQVASRLGRHIFYVRP